MIQRLIVLGLFVAVCATVVPTTASATATTTDSTAISCVKTAVATREAALGTGWDTHAAAIDAAYADRKLALANAYGGTPRAQIKSDIKAAWKGFKDSTRTSRTAWNNTRKDAWKAFRTATKTCKAPAEINDNTNSSLDTSL